MISVLAGEIRCSCGERPALTGTNSNDFNGPHQLRIWGQEFESLQARQHLADFFGQNIVLK
jgi:hypothetical protein